MQFARRTCFTAGALIAGLFACSDASGPGDGEASFDLSIAAAYIVQSTQTREGIVPLVAGRDGLLRVFAVANETNTATPAVTVRIYAGQTLVDTRVIPAPAAAVPQSVDQGSLTASWNTLVSGSLIQPGLRLEIEVDEAGNVDEANEGNNTFPTSGGTLSPNVFELDPLRIRLVPIHQTENGLIGNVNAGNLDEYLEFTRRIMPIPGYDVDLRAPYQVNALEIDPQGNGWQITLQELDLVRIAEGSDRHYYGVVKTNYLGGGVVGIGRIAGKTALGWDRFPDAAETLAHELGHNWGRRHAPCGGAGGVDPGYPYAVGQIGVFGYDVTAGELKAPSAFTDIMGYCDAAFWISDYHYTGVFNYRLTETTPPAAVPGLLVWGRIEDGQPVLEPAFELVTRPSLPEREGRNVVEGLDAEGGIVFSLRFAAERVVDVARDVRQFAFAVPLTPQQIERVATLRLRTDGRQVLRRSTFAAAAAREPSITPGGAVLIRRESAGRASIEWDAARYPAALVRSPATGEVLGILRGGRGSVHAGVTDPEVILSDGVRSIIVR